MAEPSSPRIIIDESALRPKIYGFGVEEYVLEGRDAMPKVVNDFLRRNSINGAVEYHDGIRIAVVKWDDAELVFYSEEGREESNPVIGLPAAEQARTIRRDRWGADGRVKGTKIKLEAIVEIEKDKTLPTTTWIRGERADKNQYWFMVIAEK
jgi:hypothetical protein